MTSEKANPAVVFEGEEAGAGYASPKLDLIAAAFLVALSIVVMIASWSLPVPGDLLTAPGLLPFITALSLLIMALILGATALRRRGRETQLDSMSESIADEAILIDRSQAKRTLLLVALVAIYILALQQLAFLYDFSIGETFFSLSAFEPVTIVVLVAIIHIFWRGPLWITTLVSVLWTFVLSLVFQKAFNLPLPGSF